MILLNERRQKKKIRESEERQSYLLKLSDGLRELIDPVDIQLTACRILGEHLKVNRVLYGEVIDEEQIILKNNYVNGVLPIIATIDAEQFGRHIIEAFKRNEKIIISDITTDPGYTDEEKQNFLALDVVANAGMGLVKGGRWVATFGMHCNTPRKWTAIEIWLLEETAERTWAAVERAKAEKGLHQSEEKYRTLFTSINQGFALCELIRNEEGKGIDYYMLEGNSNYERQSGVSMEMMLGKSLLQVFPTVDKWWIDTYAAVVDDQSPAVFEKYFEITQRWFEVNAYPVSKERFAILFSDITERKQAEGIQKEFTEKLETQIQQRTQELLKINEELSQFAYVTSHDLQEPLRKVKNFISCLVNEEKETVSESGKHYLERAYSTVQRMQSLINDLLAYSRLKKGELKFERLNMNIILSHVKDDLKEAILETGAVLDAQELFEINGIPFQLRQLFNNLIGNALKFSREGINTHIVIKSETAKGKKFNDYLLKDHVEKLLPKASYCHISISDNGIGFDSQYNDRIFEVFQRLHGQEQYRGTGIGLAICKKIIENHNGIITAKGKVNEGATFDIYLPVE